MIAQAIVLRVLLMAAAQQHATYPEARIYINVKADESRAECFESVDPKTGESKWTKCFNSPSILIGAAVNGEPPPAGSWVVYEPSWTTLEISGPPVWR